MMKAKYIDPQLFSNILNIPSEYCETVIDNLPPQPIRSDLDNPPTDEEIESALSKLKNGKAGGKTEIPPELERSLLESSKNAYR